MAAMPPKGPMPGAGAQPPARNHALSIASATHLHNAGHIDGAQKDAIHQKARSAMAAAKKMPPPMPMPMGQPAAPAPQPFGTLAPPMMPGGGMPQR